MDYLATIDSPVGSVTVASDGEAIVGLWLEGQKHFEATLEAAEDHPDLPVLVEARAWLERYFAGDDPGALPPVNPRGTAFQQRVWALLAEIPYGQLTTYGWIARRIEEQTGTRTSARAVGSAVGHFHHPAVPSRGGVDRQSHRLRRRPEQEDRPVGNRGHRCRCPQYAEERRGAVAVRRLRSG